MTNLNKIRDKELISHELLSAILGYKAWQMTGKGINWLLNIRDNDIVYERTGENQYVIDADHLGRLCKEWLINQGYYRVNSGIAYDSDFDNTYDGNGKGYGYCVIFNNTFKDFQPFNSELEAIIAACEWILNHKGVRCLQL